MGKQVTLFFQRPVDISQVGSSIIFQMQIYMHLYSLLGGQELLEDCQEERTMK